MNEGSEAQSEELELNPAVRAAHGAEWLAIQHDAPYNEKEVTEAAERFRSSPTSVYRMLGVYQRSKDIFRKVESGELSMAEGSRQAGFIEYGIGKNNVPTGMSFGKGDKFWAAIAPISNYLRGWGSRKFEFTHVPPKEAARRVKKIDDTIAQLERAKADLVERAVDQRLSIKAH